MFDRASMRSLRGPAFLFTLVMLILCASVWRDPTGMVIGHERSDVWKHLWGDAWFGESFLLEFPVPLYTDRIGFPDGGLLYNLDPITGVMAWLLGIFPLVLVHNFVQAGALVLGALGAVALAQRWVGESSTAWVAGAIYGFSAHIQAVALASGIGETAHIGGIPWAIWALLRILDGVRGRAVPTLGLMLAWAAIGSWYYGMVASVACTIIFFDWLRRSRADGTFDPNIAKTAVFGGLLGMGLVLPMADSFWSSMNSELGLHWVGSVGLARSDLDPETNFAVATLADFMQPGARVQDKVDLLFFSNHLGFLALALAIMGWIQRPERCRWLVLGLLVSVGVCLGPDIYWDRQESLGPNPVFLVVEAVWPAFDMVQNLERMQVGASLCLGLLAAVGLDGLQRSWKSGSSTALCTMVCLFIVGEANIGLGLGLPLPAADTEHSEITEDLVHREGDFGVIELPVHHGGAGRPYWNQVAHGRPLPLSLDGNPAPSLHGNILMSEFLYADRYDRFFMNLRHREASPAELQTARSELVALGFHYVVLEDSVTRPEPELRRLLDTVCGYPILEDTEAGLLLYRLLE